jgi:uncharacterized integral membrane protein
VEGAPTASGPKWRLYAAVAAIVLAAIFILQNSKEVEVEFLFATITAPLIFALLFATILGVAIGALLGRGRRRQ